MSAYFYSVCCSFSFRYPKDKKDEEDAIVLFVLLYITIIREIKNNKRICSRFFLLQCIRKA